MLMKLGRTIRAIGGIWEIAVVFIGTHFFAWTSSIEVGGISTGTIYLMEFIFIFIFIVFADLVIFSSWILF